MFHECAAPEIALHIQECVVNCSIISQDMEYFLELQ